MTKECNSDDFVLSHKNKLVLKQILCIRYCKFNTWKVFPLMKFLMWKVSYNYPEKHLMKRILKCNIFINLFLKGNKVSEK